MITKNMWEYMYNAVFSIFLPPENIIEKVVYNDEGTKREFKTIMELMAYIALNTDKSIVQKDISFILKDNSLYEKGKEFFEKIDKEIKERF